MTVRFVTRFMVGILVLGTTLAAVMPAAWAETRVLSKDTKLHPQGWAVGDSIQFRKNTAVSFNDREEVVTGTLDKDTMLLPRGWSRVVDDYYFSTVYDGAGPYFGRFGLRPYFGRNYPVTIPGYGHLLYKGGTVVTFDEQGDVVAGTIANKATLRLVEGQYGFVTFKEDTGLRFYNSGAVLSGILDEDTYLRPVGWQKRLKGDDAAGFIKFSKGKIVTFNEHGELTAGTVKEAVTLLTAEGIEQEFPAGSALAWTETGAAIKAKYAQSMP